MINMQEVIIADNKRLAKNTIALYVRTLIVTVVSLYTARALLDVLGAVDYGIYNVVGSIVVTFSFLNSTLRNAIQRFLNYELGKNDIEELRKIFVMSNIIMFALVIVVVVLAETAGLWFLDNKVDIPVERFHAARIAYQFTIITFCIGVVRIPLESCVIAYERMSFFAYLSLIEQGIKLFIVYCLYTTTSDKLSFYAFLISLSALITYFIYFIYCKRNFVCFVLRFKWDNKLFKELFSFSAWTFGGSLADLGTRQAFVFMLNNFYGVIANAAMGIANQVVNTINSLIVGFQTSFRPQLVKSYAQGNIDYVAKLILSTSKISFLLMFIPGIIMIINAPYILNIWLKDVPEYSVAFCRLILVCSVIDATTGPYYATIMATGNIKFYQICISIVFCLDIIFICVMFYMGVGAEYILYSRIATRGVLNMFVGLFFLKRQLNFDVLYYINKVLLPICMYIIILLPIILLLMYHFSNLTLLVSSILFICTIGVIVPTFLILNYSERELIKSILLSKIYRKKR